MVSKSAKVDRRTHTASAGIEIDPGPLFLSYMGSFRSFKSESPSLEAFYDTAQHPVNGTMIEEFGSRMVFDGEVVEFGTIPETQKMSHTAKVKADVGKKSEILGSFTYSQAKNVSAGIETKSNGGSLKYMFRPNLKTRIIALASLSRIESDAVFIDLPSWREGREGGSQDFDWTRYSNLTRTVAKGSAEFIYQPSRKYRVFLSAGYEGTKRDDYPYFEAEGKTTKLKLSMGGKYRPHLRFSGRFKYFFENTDDPFSPYEQLFERAGNTILDTLPGNTKYYYFQRDQLRYGSITNQPTNLHGVELNLNFRPNHKVSFSADLKASLGTNSDTDSLDFERTRLQPQVSANFAPTAKWNLFSSLTYIYEKSNGLVAVAMMDGWGGQLGGTVGAPTHYGSFFAETEYQNEAVSFSAGILFLASEKLNLTLDGNLIDSKGSLKMGRMTEVPQEVTDNIAAADYDFSSINQYSDLTYTQFNVSVGAEYMLSPRISLTADAAYYDLTDDQGYVYGIQTGSLYIIRSGLRIGF